MERESQRRQVQTCCASISCACSIPYDGWNKQGDAKITHVAAYAMLPALNGVRGSHMSRAEDDFNHVSCCHRPGLTSAFLSFCVC
eukprot:751014-Hanusia_phi.AAC.2